MATSTSAASGESDLGSVSPPPQSTGQTLSYCQVLSQNKVINGAGDANGGAHNVVRTDANLSFLPQQASEVSSPFDQTEFPRLPELISYEQENRQQGSSEDRDVPVVDVPRVPEGTSTQTSIVIAPHALEKEMDQQGVNLDMQDQKEVKVKVEQDVKVKREPEDVKVKREPEDVTVKVELPSGSHTANKTTAKQKVHKAIQCGGGGISRRICKRKTSKVAWNNNIQFFNQMWKFKCEKCIKMFYSLSTLRLHLKDQHGVETPLGECMVGCPDCGIQFSSRAAFLKHRNAKHNIPQAQQYMPVVGFLKMNPLWRGRYPTRPPRRPRMISTNPMTISPPHEITTIKSQDFNKADEEGNPIGSSNANSPLPPQMNDMNDTTADDQSDNAYSYMEIKAESNADNRRTDYGDSYGCVLCPQAFRDLAQLKGHLFEEHQSKEKVACVKCGACGMVFGSCKSFHAHRDKNHQLFTNSNQQNDVLGDMPDQVSPQDLNQNELDDNGSDREKGRQIADVPASQKVLMSPEDMDIDQDMPQEYPANIPVFNQNDNIVLAIKREDGRYAGNELSSEANNFPSPPQMDNAEQPGGLMNGTRRSTRKITLSWKIRESMEMWG